MLGGALAVTPLFYRKEAIVRVYALVKATVFGDRSWNQNAGLLATAFASSLLAPCKCKDKKTKQNKQNTTKVVFSNKVALI